MDDTNRHLSEKEIIDITKAAMNKTFGDFGMTEYDRRNKGGLGGFVEEHVFKYKANSDDHPDFIDAGLELKVTPIKQNQDGTYSSKERLVLNMINYCDEYDKTFRTSSFYRKNKRLLIWFYLYISGKHPKEFEITDYDIFEFENSSEFAVISRDWEIIHNKIIGGKAHEISESDTTYLAACTKGADSKVLTKQPASTILAKPRAYSFKSGFMTRLYREIIHATAPYSSFISDDEWLKNPLEEIYKEKLSKYHGKSIEELKRLFYVNTKAKQLPFIIAQKMLGLEGKANATQEMADAGIKMKIVRLDHNGTPHEAMSFEAFDFTELINTPWEDSEMREIFAEWKLMFMVFRDDANGVSRFDKVVFWNVPNSLVDGKIKNMYEEAAEMLRNGTALTYDKKGKLIDNFAKESRNSNGACHIRPHGRNKADTFDLPVQDIATGKTAYTKQSFWFNRDFIRKIIKEAE